MPEHAGARRHDNSSIRAGKVAVAVGAIAYAAAVVWASASQGPRGWGLHAAGFLAPPVRLALLAVLVGSVAVLAIATFGPEALREPGAGQPAEPWPDKSHRGNALPRLARAMRQPGAWLLALLIPFAAILWLLRTRTQLLGDGAVWLATVLSGERRAYSEPLSAALWHGFANLIRLMGRPPDALSMSLLSVLCGVLGAPLLAGIAKEIAPDRRRWLLPFALLLTLGISQLYFGYIESYPTAALFILLYLWLALRRARGADSPYLAAAALALAVASHLSAVYLLPSYLVLVFLERRPLGRKLLEIAVPAALLVALLWALGYRPSDWIEPFRGATRGIRGGFEGATFHRPYGFFSYGHLADIGNAVLLVLPGPTLLLLGCLVSTRGRLRPFPPDLAVLAAAAIPGFLLAVGLMTPVAPAQDWDLTSIFLAPTALLGVAAGRWLFANDAKDWAPAALVGLSASSLFAFLLVNASEQASVARFRAVVNDQSRVSRYGRAYGNATLEQHFRDRGMNAAALPYARATLAAEPTNPRHWTNVGNELMALGRFGEAVPYLVEGVRRGPGRWEGKYDLGLCYMKQGRYAEAAPLFRDAVSLEGNLPVLRHNLGLALYRSGRGDSALVVWREILLRWPDYAASLRLPPGGTP